MTLEPLGIVFCLSRLSLPTTSQRSLYILEPAELPPPRLLRTKKPIVLEGLVPTWMLWYVASSSDPATVLKDTWLAQTQLLVVGSLKEV
jgi:hypothetical protein